MIAPFAAGAPIDTVGRIIAEGMRASFGQPSSMPLSWTRLLIEHRIAVS
jgi:hypothetical protein